MRHAHLQVGTLLQYPAENQRRHQHRILQRHPDSIGHRQPVRPLHHHIVLRLRMKKQYRPHRLRRLEQRQKLPLIPVAAVHHRIQLRPFQAQPVHRPLQLPNGGVHILHRQRRHPRKPLRRLLHKGRNVIVDFPGLRQSRRRVQMVAENLRMQRNHLHLGAQPVHIGDALLRRKAQLRVDAHAFPRLDLNSPLVIPGIAHPVPLPPGVQSLQHRPGKGMGVNIDAPHPVTSPR